jgi:tripartite-type tricarboxylate transporter receptor subunit TctC
MQALSRLIVTVAGAAALAAASALPGFAQANFYEGKQVRIIVGSSTGSNYDFYARLAARFLPKHIPGNPTITVQIMTGASGIVAANHVFNVAPKDGTVILGAHSSISLAQVTSVPNIEYDARKFNYIGRLASAGSDVHYVLAASGVTKFSDLMQREVIVGGTGPTSNSVILPNAINKMMAGKIKVLRGYQGTADTALAMERGEIQMAMKSWDLLRNQHAEWLRDKKINLLVQYNLERHRRAAGCPDHHRRIDNRGTEAGLRPAAAACRARLCLRRGADPRRPPCPPAQGLRRHDEGSGVQGGS